MSLLSRMTVEAKWWWKGCGAEVRRQARKQTQTNPLRLSPLVSAGCLENGQNKPMALIPNNISRLQRFSCSILRFLDEPHLERTKNRKPAKQTQTNPLRLSRLVSVGWLKKGQNKPMAPIPNNISCLQGFSGPILRFLNEPRLERTKNRKPAKQTQTNPLRLSRLVSVGWLKKGQNKPMALIPNNISCLQGFSGPILQFLDEPQLRATTGPVERAKISESRDSKVEV
jgi:hypothetical protein